MFEIQKLGENEHGMQILNNRLEKCKVEMKLWNQTRNETGNETWNEMKIEMKLEWNLK